MLFYIEETLCGVKSQNIKERFSCKRQPFCIYSQPGVNLSSEFFEAELICRSSMARKFPSYLAAIVSSDLKSSGALSSWDVCQGISNTQLQLTHTTAHTHTRISPTQISPQKQYSKSVVLLFCHVIQARVTSNFHFAPVVCILFSRKYHAFFSAS